MNKKTEKDMIAILAEKPNVAHEITRVVGAMKREEGYLTGNDYHVTWALGHLVQLTLPSGYDIRDFRCDGLPVIPRNSKLIPQQVKADEGYKADATTVKQTKVVTKLWSESDGIVAMTDYAREGELIFRYLYSYIGCALPLQRLWVSSLTDAAIRKGLKKLKDGREYDNLYQAAKARSEIDRLVGISGTRALSVAAERGIYSVGRVQTPILTMVCQRLQENKRFQPEPVYRLHFITPSVSVDEVVKFASVERWRGKEEAAILYNEVREQMAATVTGIEKREKIENPPFLYNLTTLRRKTSTRHDFTAEQTLALVQKLYEAKLVTYPKTLSHYILEDVFDGMPILFGRLATHSSFAEEIGALDGLSRRNVDASKMTDHHTLLVTPNRPSAPYKDEQTIYDMIVGRMVEAFFPECVKNTTTVRTECKGIAFEARGCIVRKVGWWSVYGEDNIDAVLPGQKEGDILAISGCSMSSGIARPKPLHTESTPLAVMETAGRGGLEGEEARRALGDCGIGTPTTRTAIIETLLKREYMVRVKKSLVPTEKGLALYSIARGMGIADMEMTGHWEAGLVEVEKDRIPHGVLVHDIESYTRKIITELLTSDKLFGHKASDCACPKCDRDTMQFYGKVVRCDNPDCALPVPRQMAGRTLTDVEMNELLAKGSMGILNGFRSRQGKPFSAVVTFDMDFSTKFVFPEAKGIKRFTNRKGGRK